MNRTTLIAAGSSAVVSLVAGGIIGYYYARREISESLAEEYNEALNREIKELRATHARRNKTEEYSTPESTAEALGTFKGPRSGVDIPKAPIPYHRPPVKEEDLRRIAEGLATKEGYVPEIDREEEWVAESSIETDRVDEDLPHIISMDEFSEGEHDYLQPQLTYYAGDGVLVDERDDKIDDVDEVVGWDNLKKFGHLSGDDDLVYIRNHMMDKDFEVYRSHKKYSDMIRNRRSPGPR